MGSASIGARAGLHITGLVGIGTNPNDARPGDGGRKLRLPVRVAKRNLRQVILKKQFTNQCWV